MLYKLEHSGEVNLLSKRPRVLLNEFTDPEWSNIFRPHGVIKVFGKTVAWNC